MTEDRRYPLHWPEGWPRTPPSRRPQKSRYKISETRARDEMIHSLKSMGANPIIVSTNIQLRLDGLPYANQRTPPDPGVAVYFVRAGTPQVIACDQWRTIGDNYRAIGLTVEAFRAIDRAGATDLLARVFRGFAALPETTTPSWSWRQVLDLQGQATVTVQDVEAQFRKLAKVRHPDIGGGALQFHELVAAKEQALKELL